MTVATDYRALSFWHATVADDLTPRPALPGELSVDVAIIGAGLTGLWTAYSLQERDPTLRIALLEKEIAGFGASGRNGGWCSALFPRSTASLERSHGRDAALAMRRAMIDTVDEVGRVVLAQGIECDFAKGGTVAFARTEVQRRAADDDVREAERYGVDTLVRRDDGTWDPNCARLHPAKLVRGLARVVEARGATIYEQTAVTGWAAGRVETQRGSVRAGAVILATEGYGASLAQTRRDVLPLYSLMIATEPLSDAVWESIGIEHGQTFTDYRHLLIYGQRTADNRFAFGGRGARYHWGSAIRPEYDRSERVFAHLKTALDELFPQARSAAVTHRWGGPLGVPRDWHAHVSFDPDTRIGRAGGYVGDGLSTTNLAGRTLADLVTGAETPLTALPWVGHRSPRWEPEPLRFLGSNAGLLAMEAADAEERLTRRASVTARVMGPLTGH
ncbi:NAD(P)/FAD-dependent oxidoreductase [Galbitalea soli]|uniref:FAD-dependent oxidoreductase n=1 Tax=Galbitalea soli TaxID=1268042 RepID=A0A7C9PLX0_9MICO|nr:FAD-binding oxidoreductase [Galbitalea soli]NEM90446.1 FAD-dependent oxidoreductase [Galbitalea soli]NYJ31158.1 glycine/D-amino acid oxidase-like deaminating enzyme [Galbitalea soli]